MEHSRAFVFKEIELADQVLYQWFRVGEAEEDRIVEDKVLTADEHWALVNGD